MFNEQFIEKEGSEEGYNNTWINLKIFRINQLNFNITQPHNIFAVFNVVPYCTHH